MRRVVAKLVPKLLDFEQQQRRTDIAQELLNDVNEEPKVLKWVINSNET